MYNHKEAIEEVKKHAEKSLGMPWDEIERIAKMYDDKQQNQKDSINEAFIKSSISHNQMFKDSMNQFEELCKKQDSQHEAISI